MSWFKMHNIVVGISILVTVVTCEELLIRLGDDSGAEHAGVVEVWSGDKWRRMCDRSRSWSREASDVVCRHLGYTGSVKSDYGSRESGDNVGMVTRCSGTESSLSQCQLTSDQGGCGSGDVVSVQCRPQSRSACSHPQSVAMLGSCYILNTDSRSFPEAQQQCQRLSGNLVEISSPTENIMVNKMVRARAKASETQFWTGGVINQVLDSRIMFWHGSQHSLAWDNDIAASKVDRPTGIMLVTNDERRQPEWRSEDFDKRLPFICEYPQLDIGCLSDDDHAGVRYTGPAAHDRMGEPCLPWRGNSDQQWTHSYCRNPDGDSAPYCYVRDGTGVTYNYCDIPLCSEARNSSTNLCPASAPVGVSTPGGQCYKEEYQCGNGDCISADYVCDGEKDCEGGDDEAGCRVMSSLYSLEAGFKLSGVTEDSLETESVSASVEECAKMCYYKKNDTSGSGCCTSFSHRPGVDGKGDRCILSTVYTNQVFDGLVEKRSWNYYKLNISDDTRCKGARGATPIDGLRLRNKRRGVAGNQVQVRLENGEWGGICDSGFSMREANVVCRQLGYHLGAKKIVSGANRDGKGGLAVVGSVRCSGQERSLADCAVSDKVACGNADLAGVECLTAETQCSEDQYHCASGECVPLSSLCDGSAQCQDGSDEEPGHCYSRTDVRLTQVTGHDPTNGHTGLLEVRHNGLWGSVCGAYFGQTEADLFCSMLGHDTAQEWREARGEVEVSVKREGSWPIWINFHDDNPCTGSETSIEQCHDKRLWQHDTDCEHSEDIILTCKNSNSQQSRRATPDTPTTKQIVRNCGVWRKGSDVRGDVARIAGGTKVKHGVLPWQAAIRLRGPDNKTYHHCGAVIISPFHVLTTAHCVWDHRHNLDIYYVRVGDNIIEIPDAEEQELAIEKINFHENFGVGPYLNNDIAVVHIDRGRHRTGIQFGDKVVPVCLPQEWTDYGHDTMITVSGWGKMGYDSADQRSGTNFVSQLNMASLPIIDMDTCTRPEVYGQEKISSGMFCAGKLEGGVDTCQGDSGGPAVSYLRLPEVGETRATLMGLTSWGYGCGRENKPGVYTKISKYVAWIYSKVRQ